MKHNLPRFPSLANIWRAGNAVTNPPDLTTPAELHLTTQTGIVTTVTTSRRELLQRMIYLPKRTDVRPDWAAGQGDNIELPAGSGRYYLAVDVDDIARDFPNEFRVAAVIPTNAGVGPVTLWTMPMP